MTKYVLAHDLGTTSHKAYFPATPDAKGMLNLALRGTDACERGTFLHTLASNITQIAFNYLDGPPVIVGSRNWITPFAEIEETFFPQTSWIIDALHECLLPLPDHQATTIQTTGDIICRY